MEFEGNAPHPQGVQVKSSSPIDDGTSEAKVEQRNTVPPKATGKQKLLYEDKESNNWEEGRGGGVLVPDRGGAQDCTAELEVRASGSGYHLPER